MHHENVLYLFTNILLECDDGLYGESCQHECGHCTYITQCHHENGTCLNGCKAGYKGAYCKEGNGVSIQFFLSIPCIYKDRDKDDKIISSES